MILAGCVFYLLFGLAFAVGFHDEEDSPGLFWGRLVFAPAAFVLFLALCLYVLWEQGRDEDR